MHMPPLVWSKGKTCFHLLQYILSFLQKASLSFVLISYPLFLSMNMQTHHSSVSVMHIWMCYMDITHLKTENTVLKLSEEYHNKIPTGLFANMVHNTTYSIRLNIS